MEITRMWGVNKVDVLLVVLEVLGDVTKEL